MTRSKKSYKLVQQDIRLEARIEKKKISGNVTMHFLLNSKMSEMVIHARQTRIIKIKVNGYEARFTMSNYLEQLAETSFWTSDSMCTFFKARSKASDDGELRIEFPSLVVEAIEGHFSKQDAIQYELHIDIEYDLVKPIGGVHFVLPTPEYPSRVPHAYSTQISDSRCWMPCLDTRTDRCLWKIQLIVSWDYYAIASGVLTNLEVDSNTRLKFVEYTVKQPVLASSIGFAIGKFKHKKDVSLPDRIAYFSLAGRSKLIPECLSFLGQTLEHYESLLGNKLPFYSCQFVFVDELPTKIQVNAGFVICSTHLLHSSDIIDQTYITRRLLAIALASQWFGVQVDVHRPEDLWIQFGILGYLANSMSIKLFGLNEAKTNFERLLNQTLRETHLVKFYGYFSKSETLDTFHSTGSHLDCISSPLFLNSYWESQNLIERYEGDPWPVTPDFLESYSEKAQSSVQSTVNFLFSEYKSPLHNRNILHPVEIIRKSFFNRATLVMMALEKLVGKEGFIKILTNMVLPSMETQLPHEQAMTTRKFQKLVCKSTDQRIETFTEKLVAQTTFPRLHFGFTLSQNQVDFAIQQDTRLSSIVSGPILIRLQETDVGTKEQPINLLDRQLLGTITLSSRPKVLCDAKCIKQDESLLDWIRIDPERRWLMRKDFSQSEFMWIKQLKYDRDVIAQMEAIDGLASIGLHSKATVDALMEVLNNKNIYYRVKLRSIIVLALMSPKANTQATFERLKNFFIENYCYYDRIHSSHKSLGGSMTYKSQELSNPTQDPFNIQSGNSMIQQSNTTSSNAIEGLGSSMNVEEHEIHPRITTFNEESSRIRDQEIASNFKPSNVPNYGSGGQFSTDNHFPVSQFPPIYSNVQVRPNNFENLQSYFIQKALITAISLIRNQNNQTPPEVFSFLMNILKYNDNSSNVYSDNYYMAALVRALGWMELSNKVDYRLIAQVLESKLKREQHMPCYHNVIACACIESLGRLQLSGHLEFSLDEFERYTRYHNFYPVRLTALKNYIMVGLTFKPEEYSKQVHYTVLSNILMLIETEKDPWFRYKAAHCFAIFLQNLNLRGILHTKFLDLLPREKLNKIQIRTWNMLNSSCSAYDPRLRLILIEIWRFMDGDLLATNKLPPRIMFSNTTLKHPKNSTKKNNFVSKSITPPTTLQTRIRKKQNSQFSTATTSSKNDAISTSPSGNIHGDNPNLPIPPSNTKDCLLATKTAIQSQNDPKKSISKTFFQGQANKMGVGEANPLPSISLTRQGPSLKLTLSSSGILSRSPSTTNTSSPSPKRQKTHDASHEFGE